MNYTDFEKAFSPARLFKYKQACGGDNSKALVLYRYNIKLCQKFYGVLNVFEVVLRNAIDVHYRAVLSDDDWINSQLQDGGLLENSPQKVKTLDLINSLNLQGKYSHDRLVSSVSLGFWTYMFNKKPFRLGGQNLLKIFPNKDFGVNQKTVFKDLQEIKNFRNKIAHHEAICFDGSSNKSMDYAYEHYMLILKYIHFLGYSENHLFYGLDVLPVGVMRRIETL